jgi:hypothetical protein
MWEEAVSACFRGSQTVGRFPGTPLVLWGVGGRVDCMRDKFILNEICAQDNIYFGRHFARLKYITYHLVPVLAPKYKQHILSPAKVGKVCYLLTELYVKYVYLNLFR